MVRNESLTKSEKEVLKLLVSGYSNKKMSEILVVTEATVKTHISNIYQKLGIEQNPEYNQRVLLVHNIMKRIKNESIKFI